MASTKNSTAVVIYADARFSPKSTSFVCNLKKAPVTLFLIRIIQRKAVLRGWTDSFGCPSFPFT